MCRVFVDMYIITYILPVIFSLTSAKIKYFCGLYFFVYLIILFDIQNFTRIWKLGAAFYLPLGAMARCPVIEGSAGDHGGEKGGMGESNLFTSFNFSKSIQSEDLRKKSHLSTD